MVKYYSMIERTEETLETIGPKRTKVIMDYYRLRMLNAIEISEDKADLAGIFSFNANELTLFEFGLAKYLTQKDTEKSTQTRMFPRPRLESDNKSGSTITKAMNSQPDNYKILGKIFDNDIGLFLTYEDEDGHYNPKSILNAANFISSFWMEQMETGMDFAEIIFRRKDFIKNKVLRKKD